MLKQIMGATVPALLLVFGLQGTAVAGVTGTEAMLETSTTQADQARTQIADTLAREDVRNEMQAMGVDPAFAVERVAALSDTEALRLAEQIRTDPAGGSVVTVIGVTFVVLLVLELLGVIDVFKGI